ncbi:MAG: hypothetical protein KDK07_04375 [Bauldia sp.]|nr:hypothetical protein [Bauldia sp.]
MNSKDNGTDPVVATFAAGALLAAILVFTLSAFVALIGTILALVAWDEPLKMGRISIQPEQARAFVTRGIVGALLVPAFAVFAAVLLKFKIDPDAWLFLFLGGYTAGSFGVEFVLIDKYFQKDGTAEFEGNAQLPPPFETAVNGEAKPFSFASWDDEEERRK